VKDLALPWRAPEGRLLQSEADVTAYLFLEDQPEPADVVLVFGGADRRRALPAADLHRQGLVGRIVLSGGSPKRATGFATEAEAMADLLEATGVPASALVLETRATNTLENVRFSLPWLPSRGSIILMTKPVHMRRAAMTARRSLPEARLLCVPGPTGDCRRDSWWQHADGRRTVRSELAAIARYFARGDVVALADR
jgi:uncharacterized SAM-binding protein YcdF (DUF218 family)